MRGRFAAWFTGSAGVLATWQLATVLATTAGPPAQAPAPPPVDFVRDVQPILEKNCYKCHGSTRARGRLRLNSVEAILRGGASGPALTPGKSDDSLVIRRLLGAGFEDQMPLDADPLPPATVELVRAWIDQGAKFGAAAAAVTAEPDQDHWAYVKPKRAEPPAVPAGRLVRNAIDRFVIARLEQEKLPPSSEAAKPTLLRRVTLDLTGLPPSVDDLDAFLDDTSPDAYDKVVDRLLASPHFGERWARPWLDLARYADTNGYEKDNRRAIWKYRDWVISALNNDMPFDRFTVEQVAGDMLPNATVDQRIASGFHRNAMTNEEGGVDPDESMYEVLVDRVNTTATVWLGSTLACAQCHNHKYDPFSQKDYFRLLAFFASSDFESRAFGDGTRFFEPRLDLASAEQEASRKQIQSEIDALEEKLKKDTPALRQAQARWELRTVAMDRTWVPLEPEHVEATNGVVLTALPDRSVLAAGPNPSLTSYTITVRTALQGITALRLETLPDPSLPRGGPGRDAYGHFRITGLDIETSPLQPIGKRPTAVTFTTIKADDSANAFTAADLLDAGKDARTRYSAPWAINAMRDTKRVPRQAVIVANAPFGYAGGTELTLRIHQLDGTIGQGVGRFRLSVTTAPDPLVGAEVPARFRALLKMPPADRPKTQAEDLAAYFRGTTPLLAPTRDALTAARKKLVDLQIPSTLVMKERPTFERPSYELRERGSFTQKGARMFAGTPAALHSIRDDQPLNRLGLARWLVDPDNPLVARVTVNRLWEQLFGRGLVETSEDFGSQGTAPSHPDLLDWLATEFMSNGWSQKAIIRTIVTSATYRQTSAVSPLLLERDPYNRLLARGARFRLDAEAVRDVSLAVSGLLSTKMLGPSVFPLQPPGIWNMPYNSDKWTTSDGEDRYRRSVYTFWRRTSPYPSFMTFDATSREYCTVRRVRTNTPLQALTLLNDPVSFEAARALAKRMTANASLPPASVAKFGIKMVLSRDATAQEVDRLERYFDEERSHFAAQPAAAADVTGVRGGSPDLAAWTMVANVLLNLDETVTRE
jgi:hypothetical protein